MELLAHHPDRRRISPLELLLTVNAVGLVLVAAWLRCRSLGNIPAVNGDEAWYGVAAMELLQQGRFRLQTPTGNPVNSFFFGPVVLLHLLLRPSIILLRAVAVGSGLAALAINWLLCRWVFDRRTATISTVVLAVLPINLAYSRFAWDASQSLFATLPVLYLSLAAVRFPQRLRPCLTAAVAAQVVALLVHPTNIFAAAAIVAVLAVRVPPQSIKRLMPSGTVGRLLLGGAVLATILSAASAVYWLPMPGLSRFTNRMGDPWQLVNPQGTPHFTVLYGRLFTGGTIYRYIPGSQSWFEWPAGWGTDGWGLDLVLFWVMAAAAVWFLWRSPKSEARLGDRFLVSAWALQLVAFLLLAGPAAMVPGWERYAICLIGPAVVLAARAAARVFGTPGMPLRVVLATAALAGWLVLADFQRHYFDFIRQTGCEVGPGRSHETFRTAAIEPKRAALDEILRHRGAGPTWIVTSQWWNYCPLKYLATAEQGVRVVTPDEAEAAAEFTRALVQGRVWCVEFSGSEGAEKARAMLAGREISRRQIEDFAGRPVLDVLHGE